MTSYRPQKHLCVKYNWIPTLIDADQSIKTNLFSRGQYWRLQRKHLGANILSIQRLILNLLDLKVVLEEERKRQFYRKKAWQKKELGIFTATADFRGQVSKSD